MSRRRRIDVAITVDLCVLGVAPRFIAKASLNYLLSDPYAVTLRIATAPNSTAVWTFSRELLLNGQHQAVGKGDVIVAPGPDPNTASVLIALSPTTDRTTVLEVSRRRLSEFLSRTLRLVPVGTESDHLDIDHLLAHLLPVTP